MARKHARRFYEHVAVSACEDGYAITLDERSVNTPGGTKLILPGEALANAVAGEWEVQGEMITPESMPFMGLSSTAIDRVGPRRSEIDVQVIKYAESDLLCYRADSPPELVARQAEKWHPLIGWAEDIYDVEFVVTTGINPVLQPQPTLRAMEKALGVLDDFELTALATVTELTGSLVLGLALLAGRIGADQAFNLSQLDEMFQAETWGEDQEAAARRGTILEDIHSASNFLSLSRGMAGAW